MKKIFFAFFLIVYTFSRSQTQDLYSLASGNLIGFNALFNENNTLYGYISFYSYGKASDKTKKFKYVILDKNLYPVANNDFEGDITAKRYYGFFDFRKKLILQPSSLDYYSTKSYDLFVPRSLEVDLNTNTVKTKTYYDYKNGIFTEVTKQQTWEEEKEETEKEQKEKGYNHISRIYEIKEGGYLVLEFDKYKKFLSNNNLIKFNENKKEIWRFRYNTLGTADYSENIDMIDKNEKYIYLIFCRHVKDQVISSLLVLDMKTGKEVSNKQINPIDDDIPHKISTYYSFGENVENSRIYDDKIVLIGRMYVRGLQTGYTKMTIDKNNFNVDLKYLTYQQDIKKFLPDLTDGDTFKDGFGIRTKSFFFLNDGSTGIIMEKYKRQPNMIKTKDILFLYTDKDFKIKDIKTFEKEVRKNNDSDFLFSQYLNGGEDFAFFFRDYQRSSSSKQKDWKLYVNSLIKGNFKQESIQMSDKDSYFILPYYAKDGYILFQEYNQNGTSYNKIRLEKLNY